ncbi:MAG TPA: hypothetical protein PKA00_02335 [Saprospiraceae bacterium]|nr:hypothetical protein [Saprospiraceae bacterium]HMQ81710.1 hypothetical protein [Saprospiraceae bacterium]
MPSKTYMGYRQADRDMPYAAFFNEKIAAIPDSVSRALARSPFPKGTFPDLERVTELQNAGYAAVENGFSLEQDGSLRVAALTPMHRVTPPMLDWWFGWHGSANSRYKLWHPKAHRSARWQDGSDDDTHYIGRTSIIEEYIGKKMEKAAIRFIAPTELGLAIENKDQAVYICARVGYAHFPIDFGWLVHQVRLSANGAEMRSRFWMGGRHIQVRWKWLPGIFSLLLQKAIKLPKQQGIDLLTHCAEEMQHLAGFLPDIYEAYQA